MFALGILTFLIILAALILVHELGHFTFAKLMGVRVEEFGLGFPPRVATVRRNGTVYSLNAIPIGGFVRMLGENGEAAQPDSFGAKPPWKRLIILLAGPSMNLLLAVAVYFFVFMGGSPQNLTVITRVDPHSPAAAAGLKSGDRITAVDGVSVQYFGDLATQTAQHQGQRVWLRVRRGQSSFVRSLVPREHPPAGQGPMGVQLNDTVTVRHSVPSAARLAVGQIGAMVSAIPLVAQNVSHGANGVSGPIGIAHLTTQVVQAQSQTRLASVFEFMAFLSANLGVLNLLPVPALDGGRIVFVLVSWVRRRNLDPELEGMIHMVGMALLLFLIVFISYHDIAQWLAGRPV